VKKKSLKAKEGRAVTAFFNGSELFLGVACALQADVKHTRSKGGKKYHVLGKG